MPLFSKAPPRFGGLDPSAAEACATLHAGAFSHGWEATEFERLIAARSSFADAATESRSGALVGFILSRGAAGEAEVLTLVVADAWRRRGIGRQLLDRHLARLSADAFESLFLEVAEDNAAARRLYASAGFTEVGRRKGYYPASNGGPPVGALVLRKPIL